MQAKYEARVKYLKMAYDALASYIALSDDEDKEQLTDRLAALSGRKR